MRRHALLSILELEYQIRGLALASYRRWAGAASAVVLPVFTAAAEEPEQPTIPPDVAAIAAVYAVWQTELDTEFLPGFERLLNALLTAALAGWGLVDIDIPDDGSPERVSTEQAVRSAPALVEWRTRYVAAVRDRLAELPGTVEQELARDVQRGIDAGETVAQLRTRVQAALTVPPEPAAPEPTGRADAGPAASEPVNPWESRADTTARTLAGSLYNAATLEAARFAHTVSASADSGEELELDKVWLATIDGRTRRTHAAADGQRVPLDAHFRVGTAFLDQPGDPDGPPGEVLNCRCAVFILERGDPLPGEDDRQTERGPGDSVVQNRQPGQSRQDQIDQWRADGIVRARDDPDGYGVASAAPMEENTMAGTQFEAMLMPTGVIGRSGMSMLAADAQLVDTKLPLALKWQREDTMGHDGSVTVGAIETLELRESGLWATGTLLDNADTTEVVQQIQAGVTAPSAELVVRSETLTDESGTPITPETAEELWMDGKPVLMRMDVVEIVGASLVSVPEFRETSITLGEQVDGAPDLALVAAAVIEEDRYAPELFEDPQLAEPTPIHVTETGRVVGHLAAWGTCHTAYRDRCVTPYRSNSGYAEFHQSHVLLESGDRLRVGRLTVGGGHGPAGQGMRAALEHYDNVATAWAFVRAGEDEHGIWVSGVVNPAADQAMVRQALTAPHSGHWERVGGAPELVAAHAVNSPGFPIVTRKRDRTGDLAMVASFSPRHSRPAFDTSILDDVARRAVAEYTRHQAGMQRVGDARTLVNAAGVRRKRILADVIRERQEARHGV